MTKLPEPGTKAPDFSTLNAHEEMVDLASLNGSWVILYFYPKDNTSGCTLEANEFSEMTKDFKKLNALILGVSPDSCKSHRNFIEKHGITVDLLSDSEKQLLQAYGVWQKKKMAGKEYFGVVRTTFLIDPEGKISHVWKNVKARGHAGQVYDVLKNLTAE